MTARTPAPRSTRPTAKAGPAPRARTASSAKADTRAAPAAPVSTDLYDQPGHLIRRAQQIAVSMFHLEMGSEVTPIQYALLRMLQERPGIDQVTLARLVALDNSTTAATAARLEAKGWITREPSATDRRQRMLRLTREGGRLLDRLVPAVHTLQDSLLAPLSDAERRRFMALLRKFVRLHNEQSRAPLQLDGGQD